MKDYLSLDADGKPIRTTLEEDGPKPKDEEWESRDYIEISDLQKNELPGDKNDDEFNYV